MQAVEITEARPTSHGSKNKLASPTGQGTSHLPVSPLSGDGGSTIKLKAGGGSASGKGFLKRKFPSWMKRRGPAHSPQGLAVSRSRLCMEATHESPIQAVRKPAPQREALRLDVEESIQEKTDTSLLRKLWCLKATDPRLKKPPEMSPLQRATCGPIAALSRTADPQGESPLRWKPRAETQNPEEVGSLAKSEKAERVSVLGASWLAKPWRTFRAMMTSRAKKASVFSGNQKNPGAPEESILCLPAEPATKVNKHPREQNHIVAGEDKTPPSTPPSVVEELFGAREGEGGDQRPQHRLESHGRMEAISEPLPELPFHKENRDCEESPILEVASELEGIHTKVCKLPGGIRLEVGWVGGTEEDAPKQEDHGLWPEGSTGWDLAELAENPGGQGMVMATRGLGWLNNEGLGGPKMEGKAATSIRSQLNPHGSEEELGTPRDSQRSHEQPSSKNHQSRRLLSTLSENGASSVITALPSNTSVSEQLGAPDPTFSQEASPPAAPCPPLSLRELESRSEGSLKPTPVQIPMLDPWGKEPVSRLQTTAPAHGATGWSGITGPEETQKRLIYVAAVEIVEAAIDAAAEQLAKKREQEKAGHWCQAELMADSLDGAATCQRGRLA